MKAEKRSISKISHVVLNCYRHRKQGLSVLFATRSFQEAPVSSVTFYFYIHERINTSASCAIWDSHIRITD